MIAKNICHAAVLAGCSVLFRSAPALLEELQRQTPEGRATSFVSTPTSTCYASMRSAIYLSMTKPRTCSMKSSTAVQRKSLIVTTNRPFKEWNEVFPNATCIATLLDRLLHHADVTLIEGEAIASGKANKKRQPAGGRNDCPIL